MAKPSMFSKDYDKKMKKMRKRRMFLIISILIIALFSVVILKGNIGDIIGNIFSSDTTTNIVNNEEQVDSKDGTVAENEDTVEQEFNEPETNQEEITNEEKEIEKVPQPEVTNIEKKIITLSNNEQVIVSIKTDNEIKTIEEIEGVDLQYSINHTKQKAVMVNKVTSRLLLVDTLGTLVDITNPKYVSSKGTVYEKESILNEKPEYIWCTQPIFLNDNTILYLSNLPWFNKNGRLYLWQYTIDTGKHITKDAYNGMTITYDQITENGLKMNIDGTVKYFK